MEIEILKIEETQDSTLSQMRIDGRFFCFVLEDGHRDIKVPGQTRIPHGSYPLKKRTEGSFYKSYRVRFAHEFAIEISDIPNFKYVLIHTGNTVKDTAGCPLVGNLAGFDGTNFIIKESGEAYRKLYNLVYAAFSRNEKVVCHVLRFHIGAHAV